MNDILMTEKGRIAVWSGISANKTNLELTSRIENKNSLTDQEEASLY